LVRKFIGGFPRACVLQLNSLKIVVWNTETLSIAPGFLSSFLEKIYWGNVFIETAGSRRIPKLRSPKKKAKKFSYSKKIAWCLKQPMRGQISQRKEDNCVTVRRKENLEPVAKGLPCRETT